MKLKCDKAYCLLIFLACVIMFFSEAYLMIHKDISLDEVFSYGLANHQFVDTIEMQPKDGVIYEKGTEPYAEYMTVQENGEFDYENVWKNQTADVHPPLYYVLLHSICSCFPQRMSRWFAGSINLLFLVLTLIVATKLVELLTENKMVAIIFAYFFATSSGVLHAGAFFRMYIMAMFWGILYTYILIKNIDKRDAKFYITMFLCSVLGALTHYYVIVYLVLISFVFGVVLLVRKKYKDLLYFGVTMFFSAIVSVAVFPAMINHFLVSDRGKQSLENVTNGLNDYYIRLKGYFNIVSVELFGKLFFIVLLVAVLGALLYMYNNKHNSNRCEVYVLLFLPSILYFFIISKIAVYTTDRYLHPIYACILVFIYCSVYYLMCNLWKTEKNSNIGILLFCIIINFIGIQTIYIPYMQTATARENEIQKYYVGKDCLYIYDPVEKWKMQANYPQITNCEKTMFIEDSEFDKFMNSELINTEELILVIYSTLDTEFLRLSVQAVTPNLSKCETIEEGGYVSIYYLSK